MKVIVVKGGVSDTRRFGIFLLIFLPYLKDKRKTEEGKGIVRKAELEEEPYQI